MPAGHLANHIGNYEALAKLKDMPLGMPKWIGHPDEIPSRFIQVIPALITALSFVTAVAGSFWDRAGVSLPVACLEGEKEPVIRLRRHPLIVRFSASIPGTMPGERPGCINHRLRGGTSTSYSRIRREPAAISRYSIV